jgi:SanA protein
MVNANERGYRAPVICTQAFHLPRALWLARQMGLRGIGFPADRRIYRTIRRVRRRERIAQLRAFIDVYGFQIAPTHPH